MDATIKIIEEDADSITRRYDMCYRKQLELLKLVEEFYRTYSSFAERNNDAKGAAASSTPNHERSISRPSIFSLC
ncbi:hypothetical protein Nepgr_031031 [Nepenthes gracilis]|uniref:NAB domain-containing protein n=1 Tax=Nepenthes gracilis TaxID=150966 RepID=A0AAD3Y4S8_NEPGR|nr:hypothetical protein Nepgr_031031 [Nepenthes gracilis]